MGAKKEAAAKALAGMSKADLIKKAGEEKVALSKLKLTMAISSLENPLSIRSKRREIASLLTAANAAK